MCRGLLLLVALASSVHAAPRLELRVDPTAERIEATAPGVTSQGSVFLRDLDRDRRVPALEVGAGSAGLVATFDLRTLAPDGKEHQLALESDAGELARGAVVLPMPPEGGRLRWLVIVGPLLGVAMMVAALAIGRRVVAKKR